MYGHMCIYYMYIHTCMDVYLSLYIYIYTRIYIYICVHTHMMYLHMYVLYHVYTSRVVCDTVLKRAVTARSYMVSHQGYHTNTQVAVEHVMHAA